MFFARFVSLALVATLFVLGGCATVKETSVTTHQDGSVTKTEKSVTGWGATTGSSVWVEPGYYGYGYQGQGYPVTGNSRFHYRAPAYRGTCPGINGQRTANSSWCHYERPSDAYK